MEAHAQNLQAENLLLGDDLGLKLVDDGPFGLLHAFLAEAARVRNFLLLLLLLELIM